MARGVNWANPDGLNVGFGIHPSAEMFSEVARVGGYMVVQGYLVGTSLVDTATATAYPFNPQEIRVPRGSIAMRGSIQAIVGAVGTNPTLDVGTWSTGLATEVVDVADGLQADATEAELATIGETHQMNGTMIVAAGSSTAISVGATSNTDCRIVASYETDAFTAGTFLVTAEFLLPFGPAGRTISV